MRSFRLLFAPLILVALFSVFLTGNASARALSTASVQPNCGSVTVSSANIYDSYGNRLGDTWMVVNECSNVAFVETASTFLPDAYIFSHIYNYATKVVANTGWVYTSRLATASIGYIYADMSGSGCIQSVDGTEYCASLSG